MEDPLEEDIYQRGASPLGHSEIEQLLIDIVQSTSGGGQLPLDIIEISFRLRTGFQLVKLEAVPRNTRISRVAEYIKRILPPESPLVVNFEPSAGTCSLSVRYEAKLLDCSEESQKPLPLVINDIRTSEGITEIDLSKRCFTSSTEFLKVCRSCRLLRRLILRDVQILDVANEIPQESPLIEKLKWFCPALDEVDVTGCSPETLRYLGQTQRSVTYCNGSPLGSSTVRFVDLFESHPEAKELLFPERIYSHISNVSSKIEALVEEGVPANISNQGWSFLHTASAIGDADLVSWLLENGAKLKSVSSYRPTPLEIGIRRHNAPIVNLLLGTNDDMDLSRVVDVLLFPQEHNPLHVDHSSDCNPLDVAKLLVERSSLSRKAALFTEIVKALHKTSLRKLPERTCWGHDILAELFHELVSSGCSADFPIKDIGGKTPLMCVVASPVLVKTFLDLGANIHAVDQDRNTALFYATSKAFGESTEDLLQACQMLQNSGCDVNSSNKYAETPLLYAVSPQRLDDHDFCIEDMLTSESSVKVLELLCQSDADVKAKNKDGKSVVHLLVERTKRIMEKLEGSYSADMMMELSQMAISQSNKQMNFLLIQNKQLVILRDNAGNTPLHLLADHKTCNPQVVSVAKTLIDHGSKVNSRNDQDKAPLHLAKSWEMAQFLLECKANPNSLDDCGRTSLICRMTEANPDETLSKWSNGVPFGMDPWKEDRDGKCAFGILMEKGRFTELKSFVEETFKYNKENVVKKDGSDNTLVHKLCSYNDSRITPLIDYLLQRGVNVNARNRSGDTALHILSRKITHLPGPRRMKEPCWRYIPVLRAYRARCNVKNNAGRTVQDIAWFDKTGLLKAVRRRPILRQPLPFFPWNSSSQTHRGKLFEVVRRQNCQFVTDYVYHEREIGSGSFGCVFAGVNVRDGREVALKRIVQKYPLRTRQEDREVQNLLQLSECPYVVKYHDFIRETDSTWIVLELMEGNLDGLLHQSLNSDLLLKLWTDLLLGMKYLQENNILHRDLKPSNILYKCHNALPCLKISDFGLSKNLGAEHSTGSSSLGGTRCWMARELLVSTGPLQHTFASDMFACGLLMHYIVADRKHPFEEGIMDKRDSLAYYSALEQNIRNDSKTLSGDLSEEARDVLEQLLAGTCDRPMASDTLKHPFFWSNEKKIRFLCATGNQREIATNCVSPVRHQIMNILDPTFLTTPWDNRFPSLYRTLTTASRGRRNYLTTSAVDLVRFIRNAYAHVSEISNPAVRQLLLQEFTFLKELPNLFMVVYRAVKSENWDTTREEITSAIESN
ncbi:uncharacterized protein [Porites lutea]|uniref:uncharacterized protein n=1 Tax=Porites lutea TaxID=51062 RepID=UPI003CC5097E